jgi:hypothetical protein
MFPVRIQGAVALATLALSQGFFFCAVAQAQVNNAIRSGDVSEWSGFGLPTVEPERKGPLLDLTFQDVKQDGPWSRSAETALGQPELQLLAQLKARQWAEALAHLKATRPDLNRRDDSGATPLSMAARAGELDLVKEMLRQGADPDLLGAGGLTPLGAAAFGGHELVLRELLRREARTDVPMSSGQYPLHMACATGQQGNIRQLVAAGADWRLPNRQGRHAIEEAAYFGQVGALLTLRGLGASLAEPDQYRLNAVHAAALGEQASTLAWLQAQGVGVPSIFSQLLIDQLAQAQAAAVPSP